MATPASESETIEAQNLFTTAMPVSPGTKVSVSVQPGAGTVVTLQRRLDGTNWRDVDSFAADTEVTYVSDANSDIRVGVKTGDYGASTTVLLLKG